MPTVQDLLEMSRRDLAALMAGGHPVDLEELHDTHYRGVSLGMPGWFDRLLWKTFRKTFHLDPERGVLRGWNVRMEQTGLDGPPVPMTDRRGRQRTFGHYIVEPAGARRMPRPWNAGIFLDYGAAGNTWADMGRWVRAPVVSLRAGSSDLLLGWDYVQLGPLQVPTPAYWSLERQGPLDSIVAPPRPLRGT